MRALVLLVAAVLPVATTAADTKPEHTVAALWQGLSHAPGVAADVATLTHIFYPDAVVLGGRYQDGIPVFSATRAADFIDARRTARPTGFYECEIAREVKQYDRFATVYSVVESRTEQHAPVADFVGVNSLQLDKADQEWKIVPLYYHVEKKGMPVPVNGRNGGKCIGTS